VFFRLAAGMLWLLETVLAAVRWYGKCNVLLELSRTCSWFQECYPGSCDVVPAGEAWQQQLLQHSPVKQCSRHVMCKQLLLLHKCEVIWEISFSIGMLAWPSPAAGVGCCCPHDDNRVYVHLHCACVCVQVPFLWLSPGQ
jgi:hypothetical protein